MKQLLLMSRFFLLTGYLTELMGVLWNWLSSQFLQCNRDKMIGVPHKMNLLSRENVLAILFFPATMALVFISFCIRNWEVFRVAFIACQYADKLASSLSTFLLFLGTDEIPKWLHQWIAGSPHKDFYQFWVIVTIVFHMFSPDHYHQSLT